MNTGLKEYLQAPLSEKKAVLKKQYLARVPSASEQEQALGHLGYLVEYTRRLNLIECKNSGQLIPKPLALRTTDFFCASRYVLRAFGKTHFCKTMQNFGDAGRHLRNCLSA
jgi:hypothetical protein